jgi:hypothetical protein
MVVGFITTYAIVIFRVMVFNATFNNISAISLWSVFIDGGNQRKPPT